MTGKKQIWKILNKSVLDIDEITNKLIDSIDTTTKEFDSLMTMLGNVRRNLSFLEIDLSSEIQTINRKSKFEKAWKSATNKVGNLNLNFFNQDFKYNKIKRLLNKNSII